MEKLCQENKGFLKKVKINFKMAYTPGDTLPQVKTVKYQNSFFPFYCSFGIMKSMKIIIKESAL